MTNRNLYLATGILGIISTTFYLLAISLQWPETQFGTTSSLVVASAWPLLSIVYSFGLYDCVAIEVDSAANRLALVFAIAGFTVVLAMIVVQSAVIAGLAEVTTDLDGQTAELFRRGLRLIDLGLDVTWDILIGAALTLWAIAFRRHSGLGLAWAVPAGMLAVSLVGLNAATFPWPPADRGLFDVGPFIGLFIIALSSRLILLGWRTPQSEGT